MWRKAGVCEIGGNWDVSDMRQRDDVHTMPAPPGRGRQSMHGTCGCLSNPPVSSDTACIQRCRCKNPFHSVFSCGALAFCTQSLLFCNCSLLKSFTLTIMSVLFPFIDSSAEFMIHFVFRGQMPDQPLKPCTHWEKRIKTMKNSSRAGCSTCSFPLGVSNISFDWAN